MIYREPPGNNKLTPLIAKEITSKMKIKFHPFLKEAHGRLDNIVFRLCHTGEWQMASRPDMSKVRWSKAQLEQRERMAEATAYARCLKDFVSDFPELHEFYLQMAWEKKGDKRWFDMAVSDYYHNRINRMGQDMHFWFPEQWRANVELRRKRRKRKLWW
jgi:hypothetical protein